MTNLQIQETLQIEIMSATVNLLIGNDFMRLISIIIYLLWLVDNYISIYTASNFNTANCFRYLVLLLVIFNNRWRWCCGRFNFRQTTLKLGYQRSLSSYNFCHSLGVDFFYRFQVFQTKHVLRFNRIIRLISRQLCRRYIA